MIVSTSSKKKQYESFSIPRKSAEALVSTARIGFGTRFSIASKVRVLAARTQDETTRRFLDEHTPPGAQLPDRLTKSLEAAVEQGFRISESFALNSLMSTGGERKEANARYLELLGLVTEQSTGERARRRRTPLFMAWLAETYVQLAEGGGRGVISDLAQLFGYSQDSMRDLIKTARRDGYLTAAPGPRAGGQLTDKAKRILDAGDV